MSWIKKRRKEARIHTKTRKNEKTKEKKFE